MTSKARNQKTMVDLFKETIRTSKQKAGQIRQQASGISAASSSTTSLVQSSQGNSAGSNTSISLLRSGGQMTGALSFLSQSTYISNGTIDVSSAIGKYSSRIIVAPQSSNADNLVRIDGASGDGQILFLQSVASTTITLKHLTGEGNAIGNIYIPSGNAYVMTGKEIVLLQWDTINNNQWTLVATSSGSGGGSGANTALSNLTTTSINLDLIPATASSIYIGSSLKPYKNTYSNSITFPTEDAVTTNTLNISWGNGSRGMTFSIPFNLNGNNGTGWSWENGGNHVMGLSTNGQLTTAHLVANNTLTTNGTLQVIGNTTLGWDSANTIYMNARVSSNIIPTTTWTKDLGSVDIAWNNLYSKYVTTNTLYINGKIDMNTHQLEECGYIDFNGTEQIKRSGVNQLEFASSQINIYRPTSFEADLTLVSSYISTGQVATGAPTGTAKWFYVKVPSTGGTVLAKVPCYI